MGSTEPWPAPFIRSRQQGKTGKPLCLDISRNTPERGCVLANGFSTSGMAERQSCSLMWAVTLGWEFKGLDL